MNKRGNKVLELLASILRNDFDNSEDGKRWICKYEHVLDAFDFSELKKEIISDSKIPMQKKGRFELEQNGYVIIFIHNMEFEIQEDCTTDIIASIGRIEGLTDANNGCVAEYFNPTIDDVTEEIIKEYAYKHISKWKLVKI